MVKRVLKIIFSSLLAVIVIGAAIVCITQWDNIQAGVVGLRYTEDEIDTMKADAKTDFAEKTGIDLDAIEAMAANMTPEGNLLESGTDVPLPGKDTQTQDFASSQNGDGTQSPTTTAPSPEAPSTGKPPVRDTSKVEAILARFYALQSSYVSQIEGIKANAYAQYKALPKEERGTKDKIRLGRAAVSQATALERSCDDKIFSLLTELRSALNDAGMDPDIANTVEHYYITQKGILKAKYMSKYAKYLS